MTNAQNDMDKMRKDFEAWSDNKGLTKEEWYYLSGSRCRYIYPEELWEAWQSCAAQFAATIAMLEERAAAAQADNVRLREVLIEILGLTSSEAIRGKYHILADNALAHPLSTSALNTHVAKMTAEYAEDAAKLREQINQYYQNKIVLEAQVDELQAKVDALELDAKRYRWLRNMLAIEDVERLQREFFGSPDEEESVKTDKAVDAAMLEAAPDNQKG